MADFNQPVQTTDYLVLLNSLKARDVDAYTLAESPTNPPTGAIRYNRAANKFQEWSGAAWVDKVISLAGGGTGAIDAISARTALGLGTLATQNSNAINVTGGSITGLTTFSVSGDGSISGRLDVNSTAANAIDVAGGIRAGSGNVDIIDTLGKIPALAPAYFSSQTITGTWTFASLVNFSGSINIEDVAPFILLKETDAAVDEKYWRTLALAGDLLLFQPINDAFTVGGTTPIIFRRTGNAVAGIEIGSGIPINFDGINTFISGSSASGDLNFVVPNTSISLGAVNLNIDVAGNPAMRFTSGAAAFYDGVTPAVTLGYSARTLSVDTKALGAGLVAGPKVIVGYNSSGSGAPGTVSVFNRLGNQFFLWVDTSGKLRINNAAPTESSGDAIGTIVGTQT